MLEPRTVILARLLLLTTSLLVACPETKRGGPGQDKASPKVCTKAYAQCELDTGVLGICDVVDCPPGTPEPCLHCRSQH